ncbi:MAG TPA: hypothetical protein VH207_09985 [Chthoniobacterales bacterium]|nr:hypothetical protein [Chthoniobacterales bacterium]
MDQSRTNPLTIFALVAAFSLAQDIYHIAHTHQITWLPVLRAASFIPFLIFYLLKSPFAWIAGMVGIVLIYPVYFLVLYVTQPSRLPSPSMALIMALLYVVGISYAFVIRRRYFSFLLRSPHLIDTLTI